MRATAYMCKNRHGIYYARFIIPKHLQPQFKNKKEIRRSLQTDSRRLAIKRAMAFRVEFENIVDQLMSKDDTTRTKLITFIDLSGITTTIDYGGDSEKEIRAYQAIAPKGAIQTQTTPKATGEKLSTHLDAYITHKNTQGRKGSWSPGTARQKPNKLNIFRQVFGDKCAAVLSRDDMNHYIQIANIIPANFGNPDHTKYKGITLEMILNNSPELAQVDYEVRTAGTIKDDFKTIKAFLSWVSKYKDVDLTSAINALNNEVTDIDYESDRRAFTFEELKIIFENNNPATENYVSGFSKPLYFWLPFVALYTGMRLSEICQLYVSDIKQEKSSSRDSLHWVIDINDDVDKNLKSKSSKRQIPIHKNLIDSGLLAYVDGQKSKGEVKLFPDAARNSDQFGGQSQWFGIYSNKCGITDKNTAFHSFRHVFCSHLSEHYVDQSILDTLVGHKNSSLSKTTYNRGGARDVGKLVDVIDSINYGLTHPKWNCVF